MVNLIFLPFPLHNTICVIVFPKLLWRWEAVKFGRNTWMRTYLWSLFNRARVMEVFNSLLLTDWLNQLCCCSHQFLVCLFWVLTWARACASSEDLQRTSQPSSFLLFLWHLLCACFSHFSIRQFSITRTFYPDFPPGVGLSVAAAARAVMEKSIKGTFLSADSVGRQHPFSPAAQYWPIYGRRNSKPLRKSLADPPHPELLPRQRGLLSWSLQHATRRAGTPVLVGEGSAHEALTLRNKNKLLFSWAESTPGLCSSLTSSSIILSCWLQICLCYESRWFQHIITVFTVVSYLTFTDWSLNLSVSVFIWWWGRLSR